MSYQRGNRISCPPNALTFWRRYSAYVVSARANSEFAFCCFAVLIAPRNEASISVSLAPIAARNIPPEPVQFGRPPTHLKSFDQSFRFAYCLKSFGGAIRQVQSFSLQCQPD